VGVQVISAVAQGRALVQQQEPQEQGPQQKGPLLLLSRLEAEPASGEEVATSGSLLGALLNAWLLPQQQEQSGAQQEAAQQPQPLPRVFGGAVVPPLDTSRPVLNRVHAVPLTRLAPASAARREAAEATGAAADAAVAAADAAQDAAADAAASVTPALDGLSSVVMGAVARAEARESAAEAAGAPAAAATAAAAAASVEADGRGVAAAFSTLAEAADKLMDAVFEGAGAAAAAAEGGAAAAEGDASGGDSGVIVTQGVSYADGGRVRVETTSYVLGSSGGGGDAGLLRADELPRPRGDPFGRPFGGARGEPLGGPLPHAFWSLLAMGPPDVPPGRPCGGAEPRGRPIALLRPDGSLVPLTGEEEAMEWGPWSERDGGLNWGFLVLAVLGAGLVATAAAFVYALMCLKAVLCGGARCCAAAAADYAPCSASLLCGSGASSPRGGAGDDGRGDAALAAPLLAGGADDAEEGVRNPLYSGGASPYVPPSAIAGARAYPPVEHAAAYAPSAPAHAHGSQQLISYVVLADGPDRA